MEIDKTIYTPMMQQYLEIKKDYQDAIVFFRLGDFYEMFFEDAHLASKELEIVLTGRDAGAKDRVPMCGVPFHAYLSYAEKLLAKGYKVALVEQVENPQDAKGIVKREVIKILTPGTNTLSGIDSKNNNYIAAIKENKKEYILTYMDVSTGDCFLTILSDFNDTINEILSLKVKEIIVDKKMPKKLIDELKNEYLLLVNICDQINIDGYSHLICELVEDAERESFGLLINYAIKMQKENMRHLKPVVRYENKQFLKIDLFSKKNLELTETLRLGQKNGALLYLLDKCQTAMGSRLLRRWINKPLIDLNLIEERLDLTEIFLQNYIARREIEECLKNVYDLERIVGRIACGNSNGRDLLQLRKSLSNIPPVKLILKSMENQKITLLNERINDLKELFELLESALLDEQPITIKEGGMFKPSFNKELAEIVEIKDHSKDWISSYELQMREQTGIKNLKVGYNRVFGYYIEITKSNLENINLAGLERKQTLANAERYITDELKHYETIVLSASDRIINLEYELFLKLREQVEGYIGLLQDLAINIATLDCLINYANIALKNNYIRPSFNNNMETIVIEGRHPVIENMLGSNYVLNDVIINKFNTLLITGPNMSGKSTYMRMYAIIIIMAQIGCYVPAKKAHLPIYDKIFTRIGASDDLMSGQSTFMVEMQETNYAISNATKSSLILFDEIGRGTATFDGLALAQAILEYVHEKIGCTTFFSTHYHELVQLEEKLKRLKNIHVAVKEEAGKVVFLHKVLDGPIDKSYGINVAALAKLPKSLIERSKQILEHLEKDEHSHKLDLNLFNFDDLEEEDLTNERYEEIKQILDLLDINSLTPIECMHLLIELKNKV